MRWFLWAAILVAILSAIGPIGRGIVLFYLSFALPAILVGWLGFGCGFMVVGVMLVADEVWWRRAAFGLPALAGIPLLAAWEPFTLYVAAFGAGMAAWEHFKGLPSWMFADGIHPFRDRLGGDPLHEPQAAQAVWVQLDLPFDRPPASGFNAPLPAR